MTYLFLAADLEIAARTIWGEARGEGYAGKRAVAHVILNRWRAAKGQFARDNTLARVCLRHKQFSCWNEADSNLDKLHAVPVHDRAYVACRRALLEAMDEPDPTRGSLHYCTLRARPGWARGHKPVLRLGGHKFFNTVK